MSQNRKICVVTGTRAEYGLLQGVLSKLHNDTDVELQIVVTGAHLVPEFGATIEVIEADGFVIDARVDMMLANDTPAAITKSLALGTIGMADAFERLTPDLLVVLGDRYEILAAAQAALIARIPVAHIHGGEVTEGAIDESIRHAVTKMSHLHFAATQEYADRIIQMGENPASVHVVGAPGLDHVRNLDLLDREALGSRLSFDLSQPFLLVTHHPVTLARRDEVEGLNELLDALEHFSQHRVIFTYPNADTFGRRLIARIQDYADLHPARVLLTPSLGQLAYLSAAKLADVVIGNSSSGIIEVPSLGTPTVNIGLRQKGRMAAASVLHSEESSQDIQSAIEQSLSQAMQDEAKRTTNPYGDGKTAPRIVTTLKEVSLDGLIQKPFFDSPFAGKKDRGT